MSSQTQLGAKMRAVQHYKRTGAIVPGYQAAVAEYIAESTGAQHE
jgi:hypothetical protein